MTSTTTTRRPRRAVVVPLAVVTAALFAAGCGSVGFSEGTGDQTRGKELFVAKCGSCHTLADAGTKGQIGPNLDDAFRESRLSGLGESTIVQVVRGQIAYPITKTSTGLY
jgi:mono/diheme cytochrome c family protein